MESRNILENQFIRSHCGQMKSEDKKNESTMTQKLSFSNGENGGSTDIEWEMNEWVDWWVEGDGELSIDNRGESFKKHLEILQQYQEEKKWRISEIVAQTTQDTVEMLTLVLF